MFRSVFYKTKIMLQQTYLESQLDILKFALSRLQRRGYFCYCNVPFHLLSFVFRVAISKMQYVFIFVQFSTVRAINNNCVQLSVRIIMHTDVRVI